MAGITIQGVEELFKRLDKLQALSVLRPPMRRAIIRIQAKMAVYPEKPAKSKYVRTGTLGRRWATPPDEAMQDFPDGITGKVGNNTIYAPLVQSAKFQTKVHKKTGWITDQQAVDESESAIVADFEKAIADALR